MRHNARGYALITLVLALAALLPVAGALTYGALTGATLAERANDHLVAEGIAWSGLEHALAILEANPTYRGPLEGQLNGGTYTVAITEVSPGLLRVSSIGRFVGREVTVSITHEYDATPPAITGASASPDPFNPYREPTVITFHLSEQATWTVTIRDASGGSVRTFTGSGSGPQSVSWDGRDEAGTVVPDGTYAYLVDVVDAAGNAAATQTGTVTIDTVPPAITAGPAVENLAPTSADIAWTTDEPADSRVGYATAPGGPYTWVQDPALVTSHRVSLTGLSPGTTYYYVVESADGAGNDIRSVEHTFVTPAAHAQ